MAKRIKSKMLDLNKEEFPSILIERVADSNPECDVPIRIELNQNWGQSTSQVWIPINRKAELIKLLQSI